MREVGIFMRDTALLKHLGIRGMPAGAGRAPIATAKSSDVK